MRILSRFFPYVALIILLCSCDKKEEPTFIAKRTLLVYMVATNSMSGQDNTDISEMKYGHENEASNGVNVGRR